VSSEAAFKDGPSLGQATFETCADPLVREHFSALDLSEDLLNFTQEPIVVLDRPLDGSSTSTSGVEPRRSAACASLVSRSGGTFTSMLPSVVDTHWESTRLWMSGSYGRGQAETFGPPGAISTLGEG